MGEELMAGAMAAVLEQWGEPLQETKGAHLEKTEQSVSLKMLLNNWNDLPSGWIFP